MAERVVVVGGGIAGLGAALALSGRGFEVRVLEADPAPLPATSEEAFERWDRRGVPQLRHSHGFLGRLRRLVLERHPDLHRELLAEGVRERGFVDALPPGLAARYVPARGDSEMIAYQCRRTTFERTLHRVVLARGVAIESGARAVGLLVAREGGALAVRGVRFEKSGAKAEATADVVVDAAGARSRLVEWLRAEGARIDEETVDTGILYFTRFYRLRDGQDDPPVERHPRTGDLGYLKYGIFPADRGHFSITLVIAALDRELHDLRHADLFQLTCEAIPGLARWVAPGTAEGAPEVSTIGGQENRLRRFVHRGRPAALGHFAVGDSAIRTNPLYAGGSTIAFVHANLLADTLAEHSDPLRRAMRLDRLAARELEPWYRASTRRDRAFLAEVRRGIEGRPTPLSVRLSRSLARQGVAAASESDLRVRRAFRRVFHMLDLPGRVVSSPRVVLSVLRHWLRGPAANSALLPPKLGPDREELRRELELAGRP